MPYTKAVVDQLYEKYNVDTTLVYKDQNKRTPYLIKSNTIRTIARSSISIKGLYNLVDELQPNIIFLSGTMDKGYLAVAKYAKNKGFKVIMGSDKKWKGSLKDYAAMLLSPILYRPYFTHAWSPGPLQYKYLRKVGFKKILNYFLTAETEVFLKRNISFQNTPDILFIGRLVDSKGIRELVSACESLKSKNIFFGKLVIYGNGPLHSYLKKYDWIDLRGFSDQYTILKNIDTIKLFCLPSWDEPYGLVIHEMAAAGLPLVCSKNCGSCGNFIENNKNGLLVNPGSVEDLEKKISKLYTKSIIDLEQMGKLSRKLSQKITPSKSAEELFSIF